MRVGVRIAQSGCLSQPAAVRLVAHAAEQVGYASLWTADPAVRGGEGPSRASLDGVGALAMAAQVTSRLRLGTSVRLGRRRSPLVAAGSLAALNEPTEGTEGRLSVGLELDDSAGPAGSVEASLLALRRAWGGRLRPPVLLTTCTPQGLEQVARLADGWSPAGLPLDVLVPMWRRVRELTAQVGRDPDTLELVVGTEIQLCDRAAGRDRAPYCGTIEQVLDDVEQTRRAGAHEVVLRVHGSPTVDEALTVFATVAEALELRAAAD